jgi:predicted amidohydrolase
MSRKLTIAAAQTGAVSVCAEKEIEELAHSLLDQAAQERVQLLSFCELFLGPFFANRLEENFDHHFMFMDHPVLVGLRSKAKDLGIALVLPVAERTNAGYYNSAQVIDENGVVQGVYRKTHMPAYFPDSFEGGTGSYEKFYFTPGEQLPVYTVAGARIGVQICNDRLYPEASRVLAMKGAEIIVMPISFSTYSDPVQRASVWEIPLRARAYENGVFVLACNRVGVEGSRRHLGRSMIVDPRSMVIKEAGTEDPELVVANVDLDDACAARKKFPWWRDRRPNLYAMLVAG